MYFSSFLILIIAVMPGIVCLELKRVSKNNDLSLIDAKLDFNSLDSWGWDSCALSGSGKVSKILLSENC